MSFTLKTVALEHPKPPQTRMLIFPQTDIEWRKIGKDFDTRWQFPNCLGSVDGKHIRITPPPGSGSYYWNYKGYNSLVLMAIANANYEIIYCHMGTNGRISDGGVIEQTTFYQKLMNRQLNLPKAEKIRNSATELPYVFIGDEAFHLRPDFLKPFPQGNLSKEKKIYNYRLSRARRIIENVFGIMAARFQILHTNINMSLDRIDLVVLTCAVLHNFLRRKCSDSYTSGESLDTENWESSTINDGLRMNPDFVSGLHNGPNRNYTREANESRNIFLRYFNNEGKVNWQDKMIH
nr:unnamed protein product [Callosobruchus chinensis]